MEEINNKESTVEVQSKPEYVPTEAEQLAAAALMFRRRQRSREAYAANREYYREKNRERRAKKKEQRAAAKPADEDLSEEGIALRKALDIERRKKNREYARLKYKSDPEGSANRQREYRQKRRLCYAAYLKNDKLKQQQQEQRV